MGLTIKPKTDCRWDIVSLGEVMLRFDPGDRRIATARAFEVCEGGGEYNVARGLKRCFGLDAAVITAFVDDPVGRLLQDLIGALCVIARGNSIRRRTARIWRFLTVSGEAIRSLPA